MFYSDADVKPVYFPLKENSEVRSYYFGGMRCPSLILEFDDSLLDEVLESLISLYPSTISSAILVSRAYLPYLDSLI